MNQRCAIDVKIWFLLLRRKYVEDDKFTEEKYGSLLRCWNIM